MNLAPLLNRLSIVDKSGTIVPLDLEGEFAWAQRELLAEWERQSNEGKPIRIIVLKARQLGISTLIQGILFVYNFIYDNMRGMVVADDQDNSEHLLSMSETYWDNWTFAPLWTPKYQSRKAKAWQETGSGITVKTARNVRAGRSRTIRFLHGSEVAFWPDPRQLMTGLRQAVPDLAETAIVMESTAHGVGNYFQQEWKKAENGESEFVPMFFPWWRHPEYTAYHIGIEPYNVDPLDEEEKVLRSMGVSDDRLAWRRWAIINKTEGDLDEFHQEYPASPDEAFVATGNNVFPYKKLVSCYEPKIGRVGRLVWNPTKPDVTFIDDPRGNLTIFKEPSEDRDWGVYVIGGDPTHTTRGDAAVGQVINRRTCEQVAVFRAKVDPGTFAEELAKLGWFYHEALLVPETEGPGYMSVGRLQGIGYVNIWRHTKPDKTMGKLSGDRWGWMTNMQSKHLAIGWLLKVVMDGALTIHDRKTFSEMRDYVTLDDGGYGPADGTENDDTVMALAIGTTAHMMEPPLPAYGEGAFVIPNPVQELMDEPPWKEWNTEEEWV